MPFLLGAILCVACIFVCGYLLLARRLPPDTTFIERLSLYLGTGLWSIAFTGSLLFHLPVHKLGLLGLPLGLVSALVVALSAWPFFRLSPKPKMPQPQWAEKLCGLMALALFSFSFISIYHYVGPGSCLFDALDNLEDAASPQRLADRVEGDERYGNILAVWVFRAFCGPGFDRLGDGFFISLLFLSSIALGRRLSGKTWIALVPAITLLLHQGILEYELFNQNVIGATTANLLALTLFSAYSSNPILRVFLGAMLVSSRYITGFGMGVLLLAATRDSPKRLPAFAKVFALFLFFLGPTLYHLFSGHARASTILQQRFIGFPFEAEWVRTPFIPFPMLIGWPLHFLGFAGLILGLLAIFGALVMLLSRRRHEPWWWPVAFVLPVASVLFVQENWFEPEKMTIGLVFSPFFVLGTAAALRWAHERPLLRYFVLLPLVLALGLAFRQVIVPALRSWHVEPDKRVYALYPGLPAESRDLLDLERERLLRIGFLPGVESAAVFDRFWKKAAIALNVLLGRGAKPWQGSLDEYAVAYLEKAQKRAQPVLKAIEQPSLDGKALTLDLNLRENPIVASVPMRLRSDAGAELVLDVTDGRECALIERARVLFLDKPVGILLCLPEPTLAYLVIAPPVIKPGESGSDVAGPEGTVEAVTIRVPSSVEELRLAFYVYLNPARFYLRQVKLGPGDRISFGDARLGHTN